ncbi:terpenoid synthase [Trametes meyenii]|nr:terpenoid synthase [Trametes meyenii]
MPLTVRLPDTMQNWPWPRRVNSLYEEISAQSAEWLRSFHAFSPESQRAFDLCDFGLLASLAYPNVDGDLLRVGCDIMNLFFVFDEYTDVLDASGTQELADIIIDAVKNPWRPRPSGESVVGEITRQFWKHALASATESAIHRFEDAWTRYAASVVEQARDREEGRSRAVDDYLALRRYTIGAEPSYAVAELKLGLPAEVTEHPLVEELRTCVTDMLIFDNDLLSFRREYATGDSHNVIPIVMRERRLAVDEALRWLSGEHRQRMDRFFVLWPEVAALEFGSQEVDRAFKLYLDHLANWPRANECWSYESGRYFGENGARVKLERVVELKGQGYPQSYPTQLAQL